MRLRTVHRQAAFLLAFLGNLAIPGIAVAHGYAHHELAHHDRPHQHEVHLASLPDHPAIAIGDHEGSDHDHDHPEISAPGTRKEFANPVALTAPRVERRLTSRVSSDVVIDRQARIRGRPRRTAPANPRAPPAQ
jgi:hypothetical protein